MCKHVKSLLALLMVLALMMSVLPANVLATGETESPFAGWSLTLGDNIGANFYFNIAEGDVANTAANITVAGSPSTIQASNAIQKDGSFIFTVNVAAAQMTDSIDVELVTNGTSVYSDSYSIRQYAETILAGVHDSATKEMVLQMLGYGAAAQSYFGYNTTSLANAGYETDISVSPVPESIESIAVEGAVEGIQLYGMSLVFESKIAVRFYYSVSGNAGSYTFSDGVNTYEPQLKTSGLYYVEVAGINPQDYSNVISMVVSDGTDKMSVGYSPLHYIVRMYNGNGSESLKTLVQAMYGYHLEAVEYQKALGESKVELPNVFDMNVAGNDFAIQSEKLTGNLVDVAVKDTDITLAGAALENGVLTIPAASFQLDAMPSGELVLEVTTDTKTVEIVGNFVWVINNASDLLKMKNHLIADGTTYTGSLALGTDIDLASVTIKNSGLQNTTFAGVFDGRFYTLSNVNANTGNIGLFGNVSGTIKNLKVTNAIVSSNTAAIVGGGLTGTLENIYVQGSITKDGMGETSNLANFGAGLLAGRIEASATINNVIAELTDIAVGLRLATAFGKLHGGSATESIFTNCYAINADGCTYMPYNQGWEKQSFTTGGSNKNFATMSELWADADAKALALAMGMSKPSKVIALENGFDMNVAGNDLSITNTGLTGTLESVTIEGTEITLANAVLEDGVLIIPYSSFKLETMPSGNLTILADTATSSCKITGDFVWVINNASDLLKMKNHMVAADTTYTGSLALGADIDLENVTIKNSGLLNTTFAGVFDGRLHTLSNLDANTGNIGLFGNVSGTVKNLKITNATVSSYTATIVGGGLTGTLENIYVQGSITADGMGATSNLANFGSGLLVGRIQAGAKINNCIVELTSIADGLRLATAFGKLHGGSATESTFTNCYAVNADGCTYMPYNQGWTKQSFTVGNSNKNFATMTELWTDYDAAALATALGLEIPKEENLIITMESAYDMNVAGNNFVVSNAGLTGTLESVTVKDVDITLEGATLESGVLTIPAAAFKLDTMPSGTLTLVVTTNAKAVEITGDFVWVINNASDLLKMKSHLIADGTIYTGSLALGTDIDLAGVTIKNNGLSGTTFAGVFDGRLYTLSNVNANTGNIGLFGNVSGTIKNLKVTNAIVSANTAAIVGGGLTGTLENIYVQGSITKDGMGATSNLANFGAGLLASRIEASATINNVIADLTDIADGLRLATAFGKLHGGSATESIFTNCYAVNADGCTYMPYNQGWVKQSFTAGDSNKNFATMTELWSDATAAALAEALGLTQ